MIAIVTFGASLSRSPYGCEDAEEVTELVVVFVVVLVVVVASASALVVLEVVVLVMERCVAVVVFI